MENIRQPVCDCVREPIGPLRHAGRRSPKRCRMYCVNRPRNRLIILLTHSLISSPFKTYLPSAFKACPLCFSLSQAATLCAATAVTHPILPSFLT